MLIFSEEVDQYILDDSMDKIVETDDEYVASDEEEKEEEREQAGPVR